MARVCGIELKSSEALLVLVEKSTDSIELINTEPKKLKIGDDENSSEIRTFFDAMVDYIRLNKVDIIVLKKRAKKGKMAGGSVSFKLETIIQLNGLIDTIFVTGQAIAAAHKKEPFLLPSGLKKYQEIAYMAACFHIRRNSL